MKVLGLLRSAALLLGKHKSAIMAGTAVVSTVGTTVLTVKATIKATKTAKEALEKKKEMLKDDPDDPEVKLTKMEVVQATWKHYIPVAIGTVTTVTCIICAHKVDAKRIATATSALLLSEKMNKELENKSISELGKEKVDEIKKTIFKENPDLQKAYHDNRSRDISVTSDRYPRFHDDIAWFKEPLSGRLFRATRNQIESAVNNAVRDALNGSGIIAVNDWYDCLDGELSLSSMEPTIMGDMFGWRITDGQELRLCYEPDIAENGMPCLILQYTDKPALI